MDAVAVKTMNTRYRENRIMGNYTVMKREEAEFEPGYHIKQRAQNSDQNESKHQLLTITLFNNLIIIAI